MMLNRRKKKVQKLLDTFGEEKHGLFQFEPIARYFRNKGHDDAFHVISDKTAHDLDLDEVFKTLDRTCSKVGQQYLYNRLRAIPGGVDTALREQLTGRFLNDPEFRVSIQLQLSKLRHRNAYNIASLFQEAHIKPPKWFFVVPLLSFTGVLSLILSFFTPALLLVFLVVFIVNTGIHYWNKKYFSLYTGSVPQLLLLLQVAKSLFRDPELKKMAPELNRSLASLGKIRNRMGLVQLETRLDGDLQSLFWGLLELVKISFLLEPLVFFAMLKQLEKQKEAIEAVYCFVGEIDTLVSVASLRKGLRTYCIPQVTDVVGLRTENIYHPLIPDCVGNDLQVNRRSVLLTGSNMSGKTTFIRAIGINVITALTLNTCFARRLSLPRVKVFSAIRISDDLLNDKSYYFEEVLTIKKMIEAAQAGAPCLFLLDEIYKGTNTVERISAGKAVLSHLASGNNIVFVSTHDVELADLLEQQYALYHFSEVIGGGKSVEFDYKLKTGKLKNRNAIKILEANGYPEPLIAEAKKISSDFDD